MTSASHFWRSRPGTTRTGIGLRSQETFVGLLAFVLMLGLLVVGPDISGDAAFALSAGIALIALGPDRGREIGPRVRGVIVAMGVALLIYFSVQGSRGESPGLWMGRFWGGVLIGLICGLALPRLERYLAGALCEGSVGIWLLRWQILAALYLPIAYSEAFIQSEELHLGTLAVVELLTLYLVTIFHFCELGRAALRAQPQLAAQRIGRVLLAGSLAWGIGYPFAIVVPEQALMSSIAVLSPGVLLLVMLLFGVAATGAEIGIVLSGFLGLTLMRIGAPEILWPDFVALIGVSIALFLHNALALRLCDDLSLDARIRSVAMQMLQREGLALMRIDPAARVVSFPCTVSPETATYRPFSEVFAKAELKPLLELFRLITASAKAQPGESSPEFELTLQLPGLPPGPVTVTLLETDAGEGWVSVSRRNPEAEMEARLETCEARLAEALLREERILAVASHELRTPIAILSMLTEELKGGASWSEVGTSMETTLERLMTILDDLRATSDDERPGDIFTLNEIGLQLMETFGAAAQDVSLRLDFSQRADILLQGAPIRILLSLSKLVHNALIHARAHEIVIGAFVTETGEGMGTVTWFVSDDGIGIAPELRATLFDAFRGSGAEGLQDSSTGLGLYSARKNMRLMGGDIRFEPGEGGGSRFMVTHPVRVVTPHEEQKEKATMTEGTQPYSARTCLLVEDNKLVGELTANRLRRLFGKVSWVETGTEGLDQFRAERPDIVFVDQLLPGMTGSELVEQIRLLAPSTPIVGITASTLGTECERLEAAGANMAVEKPLSFPQIQVIVENLLGRAG